ncbi:gas vesicle protein GvpG [Prescottella soli]|uniref:Gas vesicle protein GvpG n=1 Tax=Prescottella soli TaxID=1543852 RepID=A0ABW9G0F5_9NOCA
MGIFTAIFGLPLAPVRGVMWISEIVRRQVEEEMYSPAALRRRLEEVDDARSSGQLSEEEAALAEKQILDSMTHPEGADDAGRQE